MNILLSILMVLSCTFLYAASDDDLKTYDIQFTTVPPAGNYIIESTVVDRNTDKAVARVELDGKTLDEQQVKTGFSEEGDSIAFLQTVLENDQIISITFK
jgi:hypothetical protein